MNHISFDPAALSGDQRVWWQRWLVKARSAALAAIEQAERGEKPEFSTEVWSELKRWLLENVFHGKCAYCESKVVVTEYGDADHYRPKARVNAAPSHPGYYWVAYDWRNLLPACKRCNTGRKRDFFPVAGQRVFSWEEADCCEKLDAIEEPLLLHPYGNDKDHPRMHLVFNRFGHVKPRNGSKKGECSIKLYDLKRKELREERKESQDYALCMFQLKLHAPPGERIAFLKRFVEGQAKHSAAIVDCLLQELERCRSELEAAKSCLQSPT